MLQLFIFTKAFMNLHKVNYPPVSEDVRLKLCHKHAMLLKYLFRGWKTVIVDIDNEPQCCIVHYDGTRCSNPIQYARKPEDLMKFSVTKISSMESLNRKMILDSYLKTFKISFENFEAFHAFNLIMLTVVNINEISSELIKDFISVNSDYFFEKIESYAGLKKHEIIRLDDNDPMFKLFKFNSNQDYLSKLMPDIDEQTPYNYLIRQFVCYIYNCQHLNVFLYTKNTMEISISTNMIRLFQKLFGKISNFKMNKSNLHVKTRMYFDCMYMHDIISDIVDKYETQKLNAF